MGAVAGLIHWNEEIEKAETQILEQLSHYQSEVLHSWKNKNTFIACAHQWITEESIGETLPLLYKERYVIAADVILDNRKDLFGYLGIHPYRRRYMTDTMILARAYEKWKEKLAYYVFGSYAAAIWDKKEERLFLIRDASGTRSLYYCKGKFGTAFSTTKAPLLQLSEVSAKWNENWIAQFIAIPSMLEAVTMTDTIFKNIKQVPPSTSITITKEKIKLESYTLLDPDYKLKLNSDTEYEEAFLSILSESVISKMRAKGAIGAHLSGGLDSGTVVSIAAKESLKPIHTYSMVPVKGYEDWTDSYYLADESEYIDATTSHLRNIIPKKIDLAGNHPFSNLDEQLLMMETPFKFIENFYWLQGIQATAGLEGVKILLNGARGNHSISWGSLALNYYYYSTLMKKMKWRKLNQELDAYCENFQTGKRVVYPFIARKTFRKEKNIGNSFPSWIHPEFAEKTNVYEKLQEQKLVMKALKPEELSAYRKQYYMQNFHWNKSGVASTKLSLQTGVWDRDPTDDPRVIQFCLSVPEEQYTKGGMERSLLRRATRNLLPDKVRLNMRFRGIQGADIIYRMQSIWKQFQEDLQDVVAEERIAAWVDMDLIRTLVRTMPAYPEPSYAGEEEFRILSRCLVLHRFVKLYEGR